eukprot:TRINITY_DN28608_c0_g1_i1.p1 TRINITY_DN28608_c0_g1~~TRINITY_DN28608_c0_g1_i1.p1  ORF type:complete len:801 (+),score=156.25 TRINITY_DN28608_c0_g1_i1:136-2538(+)
MKAVKSNGNKANLSDLLGEDQHMPRKFGTLQPIHDEVGGNQEGWKAEEIIAHDAWARRPQAWSRLLTLDRQDRIFDQTAWEAMMKQNHESLSSMSSGTVRSSRPGGSGAESSCSSLRAKTATPSGPGSARLKRPSSRPASNQSSLKPVEPPLRQRGRRGRHGLPQVAPGWSMRYCELAGVAACHEPTAKRRVALTALSSPKEMLAQFAGKETSDDSVFLANRGVDLRLTKFQDKVGRESRLRARRHAILASGQSRIQVSVAVRLMSKKDPDRMDYLHSVFETKVSKDGVIKPVEQKEIPKDRMHGLCTKHAIPETEVASMFALFNHYDFDSSGALDIDEVRNVLLDIGLQPINRDEKADVAECLTEMQNRVGQDLDFEQFIELLKTVRDRLRQAQSLQCMHFFHEADADQNERLDLPETIYILEHKLGLTPHSQEESNEIGNLFKESDSDSDGFLDLEEFQTFIQKVRSKMLMMRRKEEMTIAKWFDLDPEILHEFRSDLPMLWKVFKQYSFGFTDKGVHKDYTLALLVDTGICTMDSEDPTFETISDAVEEFSRTYNDFTSVLALIREARKRARASNEEELTMQFQTYDRDKSGALSNSEIYQILEDFKMLPRNREEQHEVGRVLDMIDQDGSGYFELDEFHEFFRKMTAQVRQTERRRELRATSDMGISDDRYAHIRRIFISLKPNDEGMVQQICVIQWMARLRELLIPDKEIEEDDLRVYTRQVQQAPEVPIDFLQYVGVVKHVILDRIIEPVKDDDELEGRASPSKSDKKMKNSSGRNRSIAEDKVPASPSGRSLQ